MTIVLLILLGVKSIFYWKFYRDEMHIKQSSINDYLFEIDDLGEVFLESLLILGPFYRGYGAENDQNLRWTRVLVFSWWIILIVFLVYTYF